MDKEKNEEYIYKDYDVLWQLFYRTSHLIEKIRQKELKQHSIHVDTAIVLFTIIRQGEIATASSVARELFLESHSISEQLSRMQKQGLIRRVINPQNKKQIFIEITRDGYKSYLLATKQFTSRSTRSVLASLSTSERNTLWTILVKIREKALELSNMKVNSNIYPPVDPLTLEDTLTNISELAENYKKILEIE